MSLEASGAVADGTTEKWRDRKRYLWLMGLVVPSLAFLAMGLYALTDLGVFLWTGPIVVFVIVPLTDLLVGVDSSNPPDEMIEELENDKYYRYVTFAFLPLQYAGFVVAMYLIGTADWPVVDKIGLAVSVGLVGGIAINTAHELGHKREKEERWLGKIALAQTAYGHFFIEHNRGHHTRVSTPEDPASSRIGESFYRFWPRTVAGSLRSAWNSEKKRFERKQTHPFHWGNDVLNAWAMTVVLFAAVIAISGVGVIPYLILQAAVGFSLLEVVNYMEHYGMLRQKTRTGRYERVLPSHSWNSNNIATNILLYHLQRHSDHHANPTRRYQTLRDYQESPTLPTGYAGMIVLALIPPIWRRVMDPRVVAHFGGDVRLANVQPGALDKLMATFPPPGAAIDVQKDDVTRQVYATEVMAARCPGCGYTYEVASGDEAEGFAAGTAWAEIPDDWCCPDCGVREKVDFNPVRTSPPGGRVGSPGNASR